MRKITILGLSLVILNTACFSQNRINGSSSEDTNISLKKRAILLEFYFQRATAGDDIIKYRLLFFKLFPNNFQELQSLYGYDNERDTPNILYSASHNHIHFLFCSLQEFIDSVQYAKKIISIALDGKWDADAISDFQNCIQIFFSKHSTRMLKILLDRNDQEIKSFWYFYFDGPHPVKELPKELQKIRDINKRIFNLMSLALKEVQIKWKNH